MAFQLNAQHVDSVRVFDRVLDALMNENTRLLGEKTRQHGPRACKMYFNAHAAHAPNIGTGDAAVEDIAENGDFQPFQLPFMLQKCKQIQKPLGWVCVGAISGVHDHWMRDDLRRVFRRALLFMAHHDCVKAHRLDGQESIPQALALHDARRTCRDIDDVRAKILSGRLEGRPRPRARLVKERHDGLAAQCGHLLDVAMNDGLHLLGRLQHKLDFVSAEILKP